MIRTALLTHGVGPLASASFQALRKHTDLRYVALSQRSGSRGLRSKLRTYGMWFAAQEAIKRSSVACYGHRIDHRMLSDHGVERIGWSKKEDGADVARTLVSAGVEVVIISGFNFILNSDFLSRIPLVLNVHPSLLPDLRGRRPVVWGLLRRDEHFGVTIHEVDTGIDTGPIVAQARIPRPRFPVVSLIEHRLSKAVDELLPRVIREVEAGELSRTPQGSGAYFPEPTLQHRSRFELP